MNKRTILGALAVFMFLLIAAQTVTAQQQPSSRVLLREGNEYFGQHNYGKAIELYESIIRLYPESNEANEAKKKLNSPEIKDYKSQEEYYNTKVAPYIKKNQSQPTTPEQSGPSETTIGTTTITTNADGSTTTTTKYVNGYGYDTTTTKYADGSTTTTTKYADGSTTTTTKKADGSTTTTYKNADGSTIQTTKNADGSTTTRNLSGN